MTSSLVVDDVDDNAAASASASASATAVSNSNSNSNTLLFDSFGILEHILCYVDATSDLLSCCLVNRRWKEAGRNDKLWEAAIPRLWQSKIGFGINNTNTNTNTTNTNSSISSSSSSNNNYYPSLIYWRSLYTKDALKRMSIEQIKSIFNHPLLSEKKKELLLLMKSNTTTKTKTKKADIQRFLQVHMLDIMSDIATTATTTITTTSTITGGGRIAGRSSSSTTTTRTSSSSSSLLDLHEGTQSSSSSSSEEEDNTTTTTTTGCYGNNYHFFNDIYYGSYVCSVLDSKRTIITTTELCTKFGFDMYFKIAEDEVDDADRTFLTRYDADHGNTTESETTTTSSTTTGTGILLYHHSTCYFKECNRDFQITLKENTNLNAHTYHPTDLKWRWIDVGKRIQVGPYPSLLVCRMKHNWGWKLENQHVVLLFRDQ